MSTQPPEIPEELRGKPLGEEVVNQLVEGLDKIRRRLAEQVAPMLNTTPEALLEQWEREAQEKRAAEQFRPVVVDIALEGGHPDDRPPAA